MCVNAEAVDQAVDTSISVLCEKFGLSFVSDEVAGGVEPLGKLLALDDELTFVV